MDKLIEMLYEAGVAFQKFDLLGLEGELFSVLLYPSKDNIYAITSQFPEETELFDMMGLEEIDDKNHRSRRNATTEINYLNRQEVFHRIKKHWDSKKGIE